LLRVNFSTALFDQAQVDGWLRELAQLVETITKDPSLPADEIAGRVAGEIVPAKISYVFRPEDAVADRGPGHYSGWLTGMGSSSQQELESSLMELWRRVLRVDKVQATDNFFDIGGHSIIAAVLFAAIERELRQAIPLSVLLHAPTPRELASWILQRDQSQTWNSLVPIRSTGSKPPLFLVHGAEGNILIYRALAFHLGEDQPVYGLLAAGVDGGPIGETAFEVVAKRYVAEIRQVQPHGPYLLGGYCLGGTIALEMAQQLRRAGEEVALVAMFENYNLAALGWPMPVWVNGLNAALNVGYHLLNVIEAPRGCRSSFIQEKARVEYTRARLTMRHWFLRIARLTGRADPEAHHMKVGAAYDAALARYQPQPYAGSIQLFLPRRRFLRFKDPLGGWGEVAPGRVELFTLTANPRGSMVEPHVRELAEVLRHRIASGHFSSTPNKRNYES
jgi:phthiocerol/phenolphthiocerol synthesis type-I polyketide synthase E